MVSDDSLRRAGLMRYAEDDTVPDSCKVAHSYDEATGKYTVPIADRACVKAILGVKNDHILTSNDIVKIATWWAKNADNKSAAEWQVTQGVLIGFLGDPVATFPQGAYIQDRLKTPFEDVSNRIADGVGFVFDPMNWLAAIGLFVGGGLVVFGGMRWLRGGS